MRARLRNRHTRSPSTCPRAIGATPNGRRHASQARPSEIGPATAGAVRHHHARQAASRAGLPRLPRHPAPGQELWRRTARGGVRRGLDIGATSYSSITSILKNGLDRAYREEGAAEPSPIHHANIRGGGYYH